MDFYAIIYQKIMKPIIITAPSGAGKTTLKKMLLEQYDIYEFVISCTTRSRRENEIEGVDYYYISKEEFERKIHNNDFIEYEEVYKGNYYGTLYSELYRIKNNNHIPLFDVDVKGALNLKELLKEDNIKSIFISPENITELKERLIERNTDSLADIENRVNRAEFEMSQRDNFDYVVYNLKNKQDEAFNNLKDILNKINNQ